MEWSDLKLFLAIARFGTLGAAARSLGLTQPTMGRRLRALETSLGQTLFQRTTDGFVLTDEGAAVFSGAERIEEEALAVERVLAGGSRQLDGFLRLSSSDWFGAHVLSPVLAEFSQVHPKVEVELLTDSRLLSLSRREADLVFRIQPFTEAEVISRKLIHIEYGVYISRGAPPPKPATARAPASSPWTKLSATCLTSAGCSACCRGPTSSCAATAATCRRRSVPMEPGSPSCRGRSAIPLRPSNWSISVNRRPAATPGSAITAT